MTDVQFAPLNSILSFILNILLANILTAKYSDEYLAGWHLVKRAYGTSMSQHLDSDSDLQNTVETAWKGNDSERRTT